MKTGTLRKSFLAITAVAATLVASAAPFPLPLEAAGTDETTISLRTPKDGETIVVRVPEMKDGEKREVKTESGKVVTLTKKPNGITINTGEKDIFVMLSSDPGGEPPQGGNHERVIVMKGHDKDGTPGKTKVFISKDGNSFWTGDGPQEKRSAEEILGSMKLESLDRLDPRTRTAVTEVLDEMLKKGTIIVPMHSVGTEGGPDGLVRVEVKREIKK